MILALYSKNNKKIISFLALFFVLISQAQQTYSFTNAGATGCVGPTQAQVNSAYAATNLNGFVTSNNGIQTFTIPFTGVYRIQTWGAQGGCGGGLGAFAQGDFTLNAGQVVLVLVGQSGIVAPNQVGNGGGGGSYVAISPNTPLCIAGGGG